MTKRMTLTVGNETGVAELYEEDAPKTVEAVWDILPWGTHRAQHSRFGANEFWMDAPIIIEEPENRLDDAGPGKLGYYLGFPALICWYRDVRPDPPWNLYGQITENLEGIQHEGRRVWKENNVSMTIEKLEE